MRNALGIFLCMLFLAACASSTTIASHPTQTPAATGNALAVQLVAGVPGWIYPAVDVTSRDQAAIAQFVAHAKSLVLVTGVVFCPMDNGVTLRLAESDAHGHSLFAGNVSVTGCRFLMMMVNGKPQAYWTDTPFWQDLSQLAGQTMPPQGTPANS